MSFLSLADVSKQFGTTQVLSDVTLSIASGEFFFLLGPSGCGKSTLLRIIAGLEHPDRGSISLDGLDLRDTPPQNRGIGMVFQNYALWPHMTIRDNIAFGVESLGLSKKERESRIREALELVRMERFERRYPHQISGGQQQRVALARALAMRPRVILLDEPLSNLDAALRQEIREELALLHRSLRATMIYVTHDQEDAFTLATQIAILKAGAIEQVGTPQELYTTPSSQFVATFLGQANLLPCKALGKSGDGLLVTLDEIETGEIVAKLASKSDANSLRGFVCIRPESIILNRATSTELRPAVEGMVARKTFRGATFHIEVACSSKSTITAVVPASSDIVSVLEGERVGISWQPRECSFIAHSG